MKHSVQVGSIGAFAAILFDILAAFASLNFNINYVWFSFGSFLIYTIVGFFGAKYNGVGIAILLAGFAGFIDSTLGWYISWIIGPGKSEIELNFLSIFITIILVTITASLFGLIGSWLSRWF